MSRWDVDIAEHWHDVVPPGCLEPPGLQDVLPVVDARPGAVGSYDHVTNNAIFGVSSAAHDDELESGRVHEVGRDVEEKRLVPNGGGSTLRFGFPVGERLRVTLQIYLNIMH